MFDFLKRKSEPRLTPVAKEESYWLVYYHCAIMDKQCLCVELNYSAESGDSDFPQICAEIINKIFDGYKGQILLMEEERIAGMPNREKQTLLFSAPQELTGRLKHFLRPWEGQLPMRHFEIYGFLDFGEQEATGGKSWDIYGQYGECTDNFLLAVSPNEDAHRLVAIAEEICRRYDKRLNVRNME